MQNPLVDCIVFMARKLKIFQKKPKLLTIKEKAFNYLRKFSS